MSGARDCEALLVIDFQNDFASPGGALSVRGGEEIAERAEGATEPKVGGSSELPPVWPHPTGKVRGIALEPLHSIAPDAALGDAPLYERLALIDALRAGDARARAIAGELLAERLGE